MKDIQISLKKLISGLRNDIKSEASAYNGDTVEQCACSMIRKEYIKDLIERLLDHADDLINEESIY
jgi:hypothetical protein